MRSQLKEMDNKIHDIVLDNHQVKVREIAKMINITEHVFSFFYEKVNGKIGAVFAHI